MSPTSYLLHVRLLTRSPSLKQSGISALAPPTTQRPQNAMKATKPYNPNQRGPPSLDPPAHFRPASDLVRFRLHILMQAVGTP
eukprot:3078384-Rhodomonas_salina.1